MRVIALDPGGTTGYAIGLIDDPRSFGLCYAQRQMSERQLWKLIYDVNPHHIVCEDFEYRNKAPSGLDLTPVKLIGVVNLFVQDITSAELTMQKAAKAKGHFTDQKLKDLDLYQRGVPHGRDACRHLLHWLRFGKGYQFIEKCEPMLHLNEQYLILDAIAEGNG